MSLCCVAPGLKLHHFYILFDYFHHFLVVVYSPGQGGAVPLRSDLRGSPLGPPLSDLRLQQWAEDRSLQRRLPGAEARETLPGEWQHLPRESQEQSFNMFKSLEIHITPVLHEIWKRWRPQVAERDVCLSCWSLKDMEILEHVVSKLKPFFNTF